MTRTTILGSLVFHIANSGFNYCDPVIEIFDRDTNRTDNGQAIPILREGRIVDVVLINSGSGFLRRPEIRIYDNGKKCGTYGGNGAKIYPIMGVTPVDNTRELPVPVEVIYCPAKNSINASSTKVEESETVIPDAVPTEEFTSSSPLEVSVHHRHKHADADADTGFAIK